MDIKVDCKTVVCFDLDDTLYNEIDFLKSGYKTIAKTLVSEWEPLFAKMFSLYRTGGDAFRFVEKTYGFSVESQLNIYRDHIPEILPFEGVTGLFESIVSRDGRIGIITDGRSTTQRNKLKALGVFNFADTILISEETGYEKPDAFNFELIMKSYPGYIYCYIGDNMLKDFLVPNRMNWITIGLLDNGKNIHNHTFDLIDKPGYKPQFLIEKLTDIRLI